MKDLKNTHQSGCIRPVKMVKTLAYLKDCKNPYYKNVIIKCMFCPRQFQQDDIDVLDHIKTCHLNALVNESDNLEATEVLENDDPKENDEDDEINALPSVRKFQALEDVSVIGLKHPEANVIFNTSARPKEVQIKDSVTNKTIILAPGEGKIPSIIIRSYDFDVKSFPLKHPSGKYGLFHKRTIKLSQKQYFRSRLFHYSGIFARDNDYLFMCQQYLERAALEGQIDISVQNGVMCDGPEGTKSMKLTDAFNVFRQIPGTPKYWQQKKFNLIAMINVLGPFQCFFTFSCA